MSRLYVVVASGEYASRPFETAQEADEHREFLLQCGGYGEGFQIHVEVFDSPAEQLEDLREKLEEALGEVDQLQQENHDLEQRLVEYRQSEELAQAGT